MALVLLLPSPPPPPAPRFSFYCVSKLGASVYSIRALPLLAVRLRRRRRLSSPFLLLSRPSFSLFASIVKIFKSFPSVARESLREITIIIVPIDRLQFRDKFCSRDEKFSSTEESGRSRFLLLRLLLLLLLLLSLSLSSFLSFFSKSSSVSLKKATGTPCERIFQRLFARKVARKRSSRFTWKCSLAQITQDPRTTLKFVLATWYRRVCFRALIRERKRFHGRH